MYICCPRQTRAASCWTQRLKSGKRTNQIRVRHTWRQHNQYMTKRQTRSSRRTGDSKLLSAWGCALFSQPHRHQKLQPRLLGGAADQPTQRISFRLRCGIESGTMRRPRIDIVPHKSLLDWRKYPCEEEYAMRRGGLPRKKDVMVRSVPTACASG